VNGANAIKLTDTVSRRYCPWTNGWKSCNHIGDTKYFQLRWNIFRKLHGSKLQWHSEATVSQRFRCQMWYKEVKRRIYCPPAVLKQGTGNTVSCLSGSWGGARARIR